MSSSTEIEAIAQSIAEKPAVLEHRLVAAMETAAKRICAESEIVQGLNAADSIAPGLVIADDATAQNVVDLVKVVIAGEKALALQEGLVLRIPRQMEAAVKATLANLRAKLKSARERGNNMRVQWQDEVERRAAAEETRQREAAAAAARKAAEEAEPFGEDPPPVAEVAPVAVPRTVAGGAGKSHTQTRTSAVEIVDIALCPTAWLVLAPAVAKAEFDLAVLKREISQPKPNESVVWKGVRFVANRTAVNR